MRLHTAGIATGFRESLIGRISREPLPKADRRNCVLVISISKCKDYDLDGYTATVTTDNVDSIRDSSSHPIVHSVRDVEDLRSGYVVAVEPNGFIRTLYRPDSQHNWLLVTERCNSNCLMCSQPPKDHNDVPGLTERNLRLLDLIDPAPSFLGITGGEPTLLGERLLKLITKLRDLMPNTAVHMLTNGRRFAWPDFTREFAAINHRNLSLGIPLYSDDARLHDYVVQAEGAFDQTVLGLHELARHGIAIEVRVVLHAATIPRLKHLAEYICRNLTFIDHVALMGLEHTGYAPRNMDQLWIDPVDYQEQLEAAVKVLARTGIETRIYNHQLCVLKRSLWKYSVKSISDWKNVYSRPCDTCAVRDDCGGFFQWTTKMQSRGIHAITQEEVGKCTSFIS
jgi:His-Xaa-Ser system radical SAM maturase HxsC